MAIDRSDSEERQTRLQGMIDEFEEARRRRLVKAGMPPVVKSPALEPPLLPTASNEG